MGTEACLNCLAPIKGRFLPNNATADEDISFINDLTGTNISGACERCYSGLHSNALNRIKDRIETARDAVRRASLTMPIASIHAPPGWDFEVIGLVTAQSVTGTGVFSDITSAFTDLLGTQSGAYHQKLRAGEDLCKASLRLQALERTANAVIGVDVDYAEVGGQRAMLMVCMTGTAVRIRNPEVIADDLVTDLEQLSKSYAELLSITAIAKKHRVTVG